MRIVSYLVNYNRVFFKFNKVIISIITAIYSLIMFYLTNILRYSPIMIIGTWSYLFSS